MIVVSVPIKWRLSSDASIFLFTFNVTVPFNVVPASIAAKEIRGQIPGNEVMGFSFLIHEHEWDSHPF
jgi:hypothetical protein